MVSSFGKILGLDRHANCYILFLCAIILWLITRNFANDEKVFTFLSFGLTITSFFLSLITIFYSLLESTKTTSILSTIEATARHIDTVASTVSADIGRVSAGILDVRQIASDTKDAVEAKREESRSVRENTPSQESPETHSVIPFTLTDFFLSKISHAGIVWLYALTKCHETSMPLDLTKLHTSGTEPERILEYDYCQGMVVGLHAAQVLYYTSKDEIFTVSSVADGLTSTKVQEELERRLSEIKTEIAKATEQSSTSVDKMIVRDLERDKNIIDAYFRSS